MESREIVTVKGQDVTVGTSKDWRGLVADFIAAQDVRESSRSLYTRTLSLYFEWVFRTGRTLSDLSRTDILAYKDELLETLSPLTTGSYLQVVRKFYEWAESEKYYPNIAKGVKSPKKKNQFKKQHLSEGKSKELLEHFQSISLRDYAIVNLILRTGLRTIEVVRANVEDVSFMGEQRILRVWGKGRDDKSDFVVLTEKAYRPIKDYLSTRKGIKGSDPLFVSNSRQNKGERLTTRSISGICKEGLTAIGLDGKEFTAHSLRHTTATTLLKHGATLYDIQNVLRHTNPATSEIYLESIKTEQRLAQAPEARLDGAF